MARSQRSRFLLRIEDLDPQRSRRQFEDGQLDDLRTIGIDWDGPPVRQSERGSLYDAALGELEAAGHLYPCFCTRAEIREAASAPHGALPEGAYPGTCRSLGRSERASRISSGEPFALRVRAHGARVSFEDRFHGVRSTVVDGFVVRRADGVPAYQLAVVVDDAAQRIQEVVRGADLLDTTPRQIFLAGLLQLPVPRYAHVPLVLGHDGARLAKRHDAATLADRRERVSMTLGLLAHSLGLVPDHCEVASASELLAGFDPDAVPLEPFVLQDVPSERA